MFKTKNKILKILLDDEVELIVNFVEQRKNE